MADGLNDGGQPQERQEGGRGGEGRFPGGRGPREGAGREGGGRDQGGFRIRLSDNELRAARAVQEAFGLRSTVAALGLSIRTVAQLLEEGKLDEVLAQHRAQAGSRPQGEVRSRRGEGRSEGRGEVRSEGRGERGVQRANPFARPSRPAAPVVAAEAEAAAEAPEASDTAAAIAGDGLTEASAGEAPVEVPDAGAAAPEAGSTEASPAEA